MSATSSNSDSPLTLPIATIQPTFLTVLSEVESGLIPFDDFWISCYKTSSPSVHAKVHVSLDEVNRDKVNMEPKDGDVKIECYGDDVRFMSLFYRALDEGMYFHSILFH